MLVAKFSGFWTPALKKMPFKYKGIPASDKGFISGVLQRNRTKRIDVDIDISIV